MNVSDTGELRGADLSGKRVLVVGLGKSGAAAAHWLARQGARVTVSEVQDAVVQTAGFADQAVDAARQQEADTSRLADVIREAEAVSVDQARIAEQVSVDVAEQAHGISELAEAARGLTSLVGQLESLTARFALPREIVVDREGE